MSDIQIAALVLFGITTTAACWVLVELNRGVQGIDGTAASLARAKRRARQATVIIGSWLVSVGLVIASVQDWVEALPLLIIGPAYIGVGRFAWSRYDRDHP